MVVELVLRPGRRCRCGREGLLVKHDDGWAHVVHHEDFWWRSTGSLMRHLDGPLVGEFGMRAVEWMLLPVARSRTPEEALAKAAFHQECSGEPTPWDEDEGHDEFDPVHEDWCRWQWSVKPEEDWWP